MRDENRLTPAESSPAAGRRVLRHIWSFASLVLVLGTWSARAEDREPVVGTLAGGSPNGMFAVVGEAVTEAVRREYPGSSFLYEPSNNAGSLLRMLEGKVPVSMAAPGEVEAALRGESPFPKQYSMDDFGMIATLIEGLTGYVLASKEFVDRYGIRSLDDVRVRKIPVRFSTNQLGNVSTVRFGRAVLGAYGMDEAMLTAWGGKDFHVPNNTSFDLLRDGRLDMVITLGLHPEARVLMTAREMELVFVPLDDEALGKIVAELNSSVGAIPAGTYDFLDQEYRGPSWAGGIAAGKGADDLLVYKVTKAIYSRFDYVRGIHPALAHLTTAVLPNARPYRLHPAAARFYREVGLLAR